MTTICQSLGDFFLNQTSTRHLNLRLFASFDPEWAIRIHGSEKLGFAATSTAPRTHIWGAGQDVDVDVSHHDTELPNELLTNCSTFGTRCFGTRISGIGIGRTYGSRTTSRDTSNRKGSYAAKLGRQIQSRLQDILYRLPHPSRLHCCRFPKSNHS